MMKKNLFLVTLCILGAATISGASLQVREPLSYPQKLSVPKKPMVAASANSSIVTSPKTISSSFQPKIDPRILATMQAQAAQTLRDQAQAAQKLKDKEAAVKPLIQQIAADAEDLQEFATKEAVKATEALRTELRKEIEYTMRTVLPQMVKDAVTASVSGIGNGISYVGNSVKNLFTNPFSRTQEPQAAQKTMADDGMTDGI